MAIKIRSNIILIMVYLLSVLFPTSSKVVTQSSIRLSIDHISEKNFPQLEAFVSVLDSKGFPIDGLSTTNFSISEDGQIVTDIEVTQTFQVPLDIALVIDTSDSMAYGGSPTPIESVVEIARGFVAGLSSEDRVALVSFSDEVSTLQKLTTDKQILAQALGSLDAKGNASLYDGLIEAINSFKDDSQRSIIILVTDGIDSGLSKFTFDQVVNQAEEQKVTVYPVVWGGANRDELKQLVELTRGELQYLSTSRPDTASIEAAFTRVSNLLPEIRGQYKLVFDSNLSADGNEHELIVKVDYLSWHEEQSRHFIAIPGEVTITIPDFENNQIVGGKVHFAPIVTSPGKLKRLDIALDGSPLDSVLSSPYEYIWDTTALDPGGYELTFIAVDSADNVGQISLDLSVQEPLTIQITSPSEGETISGSAIISTEVAALSRISKVEYWVDGNPLGAVENEPYEMEWDLSRINAGPHLIEVSATDINGLTGKTAVNVNVAVQGFGLGWLVLIGALGLAVVLMPFAVRRRRRIRQLKEMSDRPIEVHDGPSISVRERQAVLIELEGMNAGNAWTLSSDEISLGRRRAENDIPLKGLSASRRQAVIRRDQGQYVIYSLKPENPVLVNGNPIIHQQILQAGDEIKAGETVLRFEVQ
jgi:hypothetical protein